MSSVANMNNGNIFQTVLVALRARSKHSIVGLRIYRNHSAVIFVVSSVIFSGSVSLPFDGVGSVGKTGYKLDLAMNSHQFREEGGRVQVELRPGAVVFAGKLLQRCKKWN
jgi:hypothetical protein